MKAEAPICPKCKRPMVTGWDVPMCPRGCSTVLSGSHRTSDLRPFNRRVYVGSEVYGEKWLRSDEARSDVESALLGGSGYGLKG